MTLVGLAVTTRHYLAAGYVAADEQGLLIFDLQAGGAPVRLLWPAPFSPFDMADTPDGGLLVLDRANAAYFTLDEHFRLRGEASHDRTALPARPRAVRRSAAPARCPHRPARSTPGLRWARSTRSALSPGPATARSSSSTQTRPRGYSAVHLFDAGGLRWSASLADAIEVIDPADPTSTPLQYSLLGHDFAYLVAPPATGPLTPPLLYIADAEGKQVVAFSLDAGERDAAGPGPTSCRLRRWNGKALVRAGDGAWYDFSDRWVPLEVFTECRFEQSRLAHHAGDFSDSPASHGSLRARASQPFDSQLPGCAWHRLLLDAQIPTGTSLAVRARAADDPALLGQSPVAAPAAALPPLRRRRAAVV